MRYFVTLVFATFFLFSPALVLGSTKSKEYYKQAQKAYEQGKFEKAAKLSKKAYKEEANLVYQYNRIRALEGAKKYKKALKVLKKYEEAMLEADKFENLPNLKRKYKKKLKDSDPPTQKTTGVSTRKKVAFSLVGSSAVMYGVAGLFGSYLPYKPKTRKKFGTKKKFTQQEIKIIKLNRALTISFLSLGTLSLISGTVLFFDNKQSKPKKVMLQPYIAPSNVGLQLRF